MSKGRFSRYKDALATLSIRTGAPLPSLLLSFGILHEVTAIVPLAGFFYSARALGIGEIVVNAIVHNDKEVPYVDTYWLRGKLKGWVEEGDRWAERVGKRYGVFGFGKDRELEPKADVPRMSSGMAGDVTNAIFAYGMTKALLPLRVGVSIYFAPAFSRSVLEPVRRTVVKQFWHK